MDTKTNIVRLVAVVVIFTAAYGFYYTGVPLVLRAGWLWSDRVLGRRSDAYSLPNSKAIHLGYTANGNVYSTIDGAVPPIANVDVVYCRLRPQVGFISEHNIRERWFGATLAGAMIVIGVYGLVRARKYRTHVTWNSEAKNIDW